MVEPQPMIEAITHRDGYTAHARWWLPDAPRGAVVYLHGIQSHGGWYEGSGADLARAGFAVLMPDRRGSGRNQQQRGDCDKPQRWIDDLDDCVRAMQQKAGIAPVHVVGVSWGGKLAVAGAAAGVANVATLTLVAPGVFPRVDLSAGDKMRVAMSLLADRHRAFPIPLNDATMFTSNPEWIDYIERDELSLRAVTGVFLVNSRRLDRTARQLAQSKWRGDVHLLLAGDDRIIDNDKTRAWFEGLPTGAHQLSHYPTMRHTLEFERDPEPMRRDVREWLIERCESK